MSNGQAVRSPPWSIHTSYGSAAAVLVWGIAGENLAYIDLAAVPLAASR